MRGHKRREELRMTPGEVVDDAATSVNRAGGASTAMVIKRRIVRGTLSEVADALDEVVRKLREVLSC